MLLGCACKSKVINRIYKVIRNREWDSCNSFFNRTFESMVLLKLIIKLAANRISKRINKNHLKCIDSQLNTLSYLIQNSKSISFGLDHNFAEIKDYYDFKCQVDIRDYEGLKTYVDRIKKGEKNVLWKGRPIYFAKTSGTTSGAKFIPITKDSIGHHIQAARNALFAYVAETGQSDFFTRKMIFLQGSPELENENSIQIGRLSGIVYHHVPKWLMRNRLPSYASNCIEDWDKKLEAIIGETIGQDMSVLSGIPPWCVMYFERLLEQSGASSLKELYPNLQLYVHGGVNYTPYKAKMERLLGEGVDTIETYPASEGFFAYQDSQHDEGLLLNLDGGIFYEFVRVDEIHQEHPNRVHLGGIELGVNYVLIVSTNAGLWAYNTGDTIKFVNTNPYRIVVTGRVKHFISAFGEHVIQEEVENAISQTCANFNLRVKEFTVAPFIADEEGQSFHEWFVEFDGVEPVDSQLFVAGVDEAVQEQNTYYKDLRQGAILKGAELRIVQAGGFESYFRVIGKVGGQNKVQHLSNNRELVDRILPYVKKG